MHGNRAAGSRGLRFAIVACAACAAAVPAGAQRAAIEPAPPFTAEALVALPETSWITNGGDLYNRRHSPLTDLDRGNVGRLKGVWRVRLDGSGVGPQYSGEAQPLFYRGVLYVVTGANDVFAIDVDSGEILWRYVA